MKFALSFNVDFQSVVLYHHPWLHVAWPQVDKLEIFPGSGEDEWVFRCDTGWSRKIQHMFMKLWRKNIEVVRIGDHLCMRWLGRNWTLKTTFFDVFNFFFFRMVLFTRFCSSALDLVLSCVWANLVWAIGFLDKTFMIWVFHKATPCCGRARYACRSSGGLSESYVNNAQCYGG